MGLAEAYRQLLGVLQLPAVQQLALVLLTYRLFMLPAESAAALKLLDKGVAKEALAGLVCFLLSCSPLFPSLFLPLTPSRTLSSFSPFLA